MFSLYEQLMMGDEVALENALMDTWRGIPWMDEDGVGLLRQAAEVWRAGLAGEVVDIGLMAGAFLGLADRAEAAGDGVRAWGFDQLYQLSCAIVRGEEYQIPALPVELAGLVAGV